MAMMAHVEIIVKDQRLEQYGLPNFATTGSAGLDLRALERVELGSGDQHAFNLGFAIALPFGSFALLAPRSSLGIRGIHLANLVGIIDSDYQGELIYDTTKPDGAPRKILDVSRLHAMNWYHTSGFDNALNLTYQWFCKNSF